MRDNIKELVTYIRSVHEWCARTKSGGDWFAIDPDESPFKAADAIEALAGEVERLTMEVKTATTLLEAEKWSRAHVRSIIVSDLEAERDRLKAALGDVMEWIDNWSPPFTQDGEWSETELKARKALGDAA